MPKEGSHCILLSMVFIDSVFIMGNNCYTQAFLEECKYIAKEKEVTRHITEGLEISSDDSNEENSDYSDKESNFE